MGQTYQFNQRQVIIYIRWYNSNRGKLQILNTMNSYKMYLVNLLLLATLTHSSYFRNSMFLEEGATYTNQRVEYFDQIVDHYSYLPPSFWKQRYFVTNTYFDAANGPVILYICGEGTCSGVSDKSWTSQIAKSTKGLIIALEHRYYGQSLPFRENPLSVQNLKYLSSKQALKDLAFFIEQVKKNKWHGVGPANKWITIGGSYPGALSAWFRNKYPHLTVGAIASSAVVLAVQNFKQYDEQVFLSVNKSGDYCIEAFRALLNYGQLQSLSDNRVNFQSQFKAQKLTSRQFVSLWVDMLASQIQYGKRTSLCNSLKNKTLEEMLAVIKPLSVYVNAIDYGAYYLSNATFMAEHGGAGRAWAYQCCTEVGYFQTFSDKHPMRSKLITIDFYRKWCDDLFGQGTWPSIGRTNQQYGGINLQTTNLLMINGQEDPWKWASLTTTSKKFKSVVAMVANCTDCAHCVDLYAPAKTDAKQLTTIRNFELTSIKTWLSNVKL